MRKGTIETDLEGSVASSIVVTDANKGITYLPLGTYVTYTEMETAFAPVGHEHALDNLSDVVLGTLNFNDVLRWDGVNWVNSAVPSGSNLDFLMLNSPNDQTVQVGADKALRLTATGVTGVQDMQLSGSGFALDGLLTNAHGSWLQFMGTTHGVTNSVLDQLGYRMDASGPSHVASVDVYTQVGASGFKATTKTLAGDVLGEVALLNGNFTFNAERVLTESDLTAFVSDGMTEAEGDTRYGQLAAKNIWTNWQETARALSYDWTRASRVTGDVNMRHISTIDGENLWGDGTNAVDNSLKRVSSTLMRFSKGLDVVGGVQENGTALAAKYAQVAQANTFTQTQTFSGDVVLKGKNVTSSIRPKGTVAVTNAATTNFNLLDSYNFEWGLTSGNKTIALQNAQDGDNWAIDVLNCSGQQILFSGSGITHRIGGVSGTVTGFTTPVDGSVTLLGKMRGTEIRWNVIEYR
jgi:hypothetical protein